MQVLIRAATANDVDTLCAIRTSVVQNHLSLEQMADLITDGREEVRANGFYQRLGWSVAGRVDGDDVRYEKGRAW